MLPRRTKVPGRNEVKNRKKIHPRGAQQATGDRVETRDSIRQLSDRLSPVPCPL